ncbi:MAG: MerR family transcriptional regulator [Gammaproteobacteria bacterium]|nr:MerR family transcriptional regulator [Gammaproteobacteria bacterium]
MKSVPSIAENLDISSGTIREYLERFPEFFPDPVERDGIKVYPPETIVLLKKIHNYYQTTDMTKDQIRVKLGGTQEQDDEQVQSPVQTSAAIDPEQFMALEQRLDSLISILEKLTATISDAGSETFSRIKKQVNSSQTLNDINQKFTDIVELKKGQKSEDIEKNVLNADGTIIFSYGIMHSTAKDSLEFAKAHKKPWIHIDLEIEQQPSSIIREWNKQFNIRVLNLVGRDVSKIPGLKRSIDDMISLVMQE